MPPPQWAGTTRTNLAPIDCHEEIIPLFPELHGSSLVPFYLCTPAPSTRVATQPLTNTFVSVPTDLGQLNCAALVAGIIAGVLDGASFVSRLGLTTLASGSWSVKSEGGGG